MWCIPVSYESLVPYMCYEWGCSCKQPRWQLCDVMSPNNLDQNVDILNGKYVNFNFKCMGKHLINIANRFWWESSWLNYIHSKIVLYQRIYNQWLYLNVQSIWKHVLIVYILNIDLSYSTQVLMMSHSKNTASTFSMHGWIFRVVIWILKKVVVPADRVDVLMGL